MPLITFTNTFASGTRAKASQVNQNFSDINTWLSAGSIEQSYLAAFTEDITWNISSPASQAIVVNQASNENSIEIAQSAVIAASRATIRLIDSAAQTSGLGNLSIQATNSSHAIPLVKLRSAGSGPYIKSSDSSDVMQWQVTKGSGMEYDVASGSSHNFKINGTSAAILNATRLALSDSTELRFGSSNGPSFSRVSSTEINYDSDKIRFGDVTLYRVSSSRLRITSTTPSATEFELEGAGGSVKFKNETYGLDITNSASNRVNIANKPIAVGVSDYPSNNYPLVMHGFLNSDGTGTGYGFTVSASGSGWNLSYTNSFNEAPSVVATLIDDPLVDYNRGSFIHVPSNSTTGCEIRVRTRDPNLGGIVSTARKNLYVVIMGRRSS